MSRRVAAALVVGLVGVLGLLVLPPALAHGSMSVPASRTYACRFEQPDNPMCAQAWKAGEQALYDWMEVNVPDAAGNHQAKVPDGKLCSAGRDKYAAFDVPGDWPLTALQPGAGGHYQLTFTATAPHATAYYRVLLTRLGFDARKDRLRWSDLVQVHDSGPLPAASSRTFAVDLPTRTTPAILYVVWQRSDSPEAFYSCSDVTVGVAGPSTTTTTARPGPTTTTSPRSTTTSTTTVPSGDEPFSPVTGIAVSSRTTAAWGGGRCLEVRVTDTTSKPLSWEVHLRPPGNITSLWNASAIEQHHAGHEGHMAFVGESWNARLAAKASTTFGMCVAG